MRQGCRIALILPVLDEERALPAVLSQVPDWVDLVIVADNGSQDRSAAIARAHGAEVVAEPRRGYGWACRAGIEAVPEADICVFADGDAQDRLTDMAALVDPIADGGADFVLASRTLGRADRGALTLPQRVGNRLACTLIARFWGHRYTDLGPFRAIRREALCALDLTQMTYGWTVEMQIRALKAGLRVREVPSDYRRRVGRSKVSGTLRGIWGAGTRILAVIAAEARRG